MNLDEILKAVTLALAAEEYGQAKEWAKQLSLYVDLMERYRRLSAPWIGQTFGDVPPADWGPGPLGQQSFPAASDD